MAKNVWNILELLKNSKQMNFDFAFLVLNQPILCDSKLIKSLWSQAIVRALVDGGSNRWLDFIEKETGSDLCMPDFISGDFDSISPEAKYYFEKNGVDFISTPDQDETDFTKSLGCLNEILTRKQLEANVIFVLCEMSGRFDQAMANINTLHKSAEFLPTSRVIILSSQSITWILQPGSNVIHVTDDYVKNELNCGLIPVCGATKIKTSGLKWNMDEIISEFGKLVSTSNTFSETEIRIDCDRKVVWTSNYCFDES